jgi:hypothetical protein
MAHQKCILLATLMALNLFLPIPVRGTDNIVPPGSIPNEDERKEYERIDKELARINTGLTDKATLAPERKSLKAQRDKLRAERKKIDSERAKRAVWIPGAMYFKDPSHTYPDFSTPEATVATVYEAVHRRDEEVLQESRISKEKLDYSGKEVLGFKFISSKPVQRPDQWAKPGDWEIIVQESLPENRPPLHMWYLLRKSVNGWKIAESVWAADENYPDPDLVEDETATLPEDRRVIKTWERVIVLKTTPQYEDATTEISVFDLNGAATGPSLTLQGEVEVKVLERRKRVLAANRSSHFEVTESYLLDQDGKVVKKIRQEPTTKEYRVSDDGNIFWRLTANVMKGKPVIGLDVFDFDGKLVESRSYDRALEAEIPVKRFGRSYRIQIPEPDFPG